jgi:predicted O-methyltransferase YrrM
MLLTKNKYLRVACGTLETLSYIGIKLWLKNPSAAHRYPGKVFREYMSLVGRDRWISKGIQEVFPLGSARVVIEHLPGQGIATPIDELAYLAIITRVVSPKSVFEIGTFRGRTALTFALNSDPDCVVYTLDLPPDGRAAAKRYASTADQTIIDRSETGIDYKAKDVSFKIRQLYGNSLSFDFTSYAGEIDLVFIDGAHHYEAVKSDTQNALRMLRSGGWVVWHDFANYGDYNDVVRAVLDILPANEIVQIENSQLATYQKISDRTQPRMATCKCDMAPRQKAVDGASIAVANRDHQG